MLGSTLVAHGKELLIWAAEWVLKSDPEVMWEMETLFGRQWGTIAGSGGQESGGGGAI